MHPSYQHIVISVLTVLALMLSGVGYAQNITNGLLDTRSGCQSMQNTPRHVMGISNTDSSRVSKVTLHVDSLNCHDNPSLKGSHCPSCSTNVIAISSFDDISLSVTKPILNPTIHLHSDSITSPPLSKPPIQSFAC